MGAYCTVCGTKIDEGSGVVYGNTEICKACSAAFQEEKNGRQEKNNYEEDDDECIVYEGSRTSVWADFF